MRLWHVRHLLHHQSLHICFLMSTPHSNLSVLPPVLVELSETLGEHDQNFTLIPFLCILLSTHQNYFAYQYVIHELPGQGLF